MSESEEQQIPELGEEQLFQSGEDAFPGQVGDSFVPIYVPDSAIDTFSTTELTKKFHKTCNQYLTQLRFGTGQPAATYNTVIDTRLLLLGTRKRLFELKERSVISIDPTDYKYVLYGYLNGTVGIINLCKSSDQATRLETPDQNGHPVLDFTWCKTDNRLFVSAFANGALKVFDAEYCDVAVEYYVTHRITSLNMHLGVNSLLAYTLERGEATLLDIVSGHNTHQISWKNHCPNVVQWHPRDQHFLFVGSREGMGAMFDIRQTRRPVREITYPDFGAQKSKFSLSSAKFTDDGSKLVWVDVAGKVRVFTMENGTQECAFSIVRSRLGSYFGQVFFDLIKEGSEYRVIVPCQSDLAIMSLSPNVPSRVYKVLRTGFLGQVISVQYRKGMQHIIASSKSDMGIVIEPNIDNVSDDPSDDELEDNYSSDEY